MTRSIRTQERLDRYAATAEVPLLVLAVVFLLVISLPVIEPDLESWQSTALDIVNWAIWAAFAADYVFRLALSEQRLRFMRQHPLELAAVLLPALRPLRLLRLLVIGNLLATRSRQNLAGQAGKLVLAIGSVLVFLGAVGVLSAERDAEGGNITSFTDAVWWASTTITTVGYGDRFPVTEIGRAIAVCLMVSGIALFGVLTASVAAWFVGASQEGSDHADLVARLDRLEKLLQERAAD